MSTSTSARHSHRAVEALTPDVGTTPSLRHGAPSHDTGRTPDTRRTPPSPSPSVSSPRHDSGRTPYAGPEPESEPRRRRLLPRGRRGLVVALSSAAIAVTAPAFAYWLATTTADTTVTADHLHPPASVSAGTPTATSVTITVAAPSAGPTPANYLVRTTTGGPTVECPTVAESCTLTGLKSGTAYTFRATSRLHSWTSIETTGASFTTAAAPTPGTPVLAAGSDSGSPGDRITNDATPTVTGAAQAGLADAQITVLDGSTVVGTTTANGSGAWSVTTSTLADGEHSLTAKAAFNGGANGPASAALVLTVDTQAPTSIGASSVTCGSGSASSSGGTYMCNSSVWVSGTGLRLTFSGGDTSPSSGLSSFRFTSSFNASAAPSDPIAPTADTGTEVAFGSQTSSGVFTGQGHYKISVIAIDRAGNASSTTSLAALVDSVAPTANVALANGASVSLKAETNDTFTVTFSESMDPAKFCPGWDGTAKSATVTLSHTVASADDTLALSGATVSGCQFGTVGLGAKYAGNGANKSITFTGSTVAVTTGGTKLVVLLGTGIGPSTVTSAGTSTWTAPTLSPAPATDLAGNSLTTASATTTTGF
jgi:hypothetical protein